MIIRSTLQQSKEDELELPPSLSLVVISVLSDKRVIIR